MEKHSEDESFQVTCTHTQTNHADPRSVFDSFDQSSSDDAYSSGVVPESLKAVAVYQ